MIAEVGGGLTLVLLVALTWGALRSRSRAELARQAAVRDLAIAEAALRDSEARHRALLDAATSDRDAAARARTQAELLEAHANDLTELTVGLEAAYRELESFTYAISHDLRAPLRAVGGFSAALLSDYGDNLDEKGQHYLRRISAAASRMSAMIDALLSLSRIARSDVKHDDIDLDVIAAAAVEELQRAQPERQVVTRIQPALHARGDARLLRIVFDNLLGNAWKFTAKQPAPLVEVGVLQQGDESVFFVRDNGEGFDMRYATRLFIPFQRLVSAGDVPGTGIGLATVERIVRRHGGRIWTESEPGRGATFLFTLRPEQT